MKSDKLKFFLYARKSSESEDRQIQSINDQTDRLKKIAENLNIKIVEVLTESKSAKKPNNRPIFSDMIERIKKGEAEGILCWQINRLSRNPVDSGDLQWLLQTETLKSIQTIDREYKPGDNALLFSVESGVANQFILDLRKNVIRGMDSKAQSGWMPNMAPLGYLNDKETKTIVKDPERFPLVRKMFDLMLAGTYTPRQILDTANEEWGFRTRKTKNAGDNPLSYSGIYRIFSNPFYLGIVQYNGEQFDGKHEPMITTEEYDRVQQLLGKRGKPRKRKHDHPYTCFARCEECGCYYVGETKTKYIKSTGETKNFPYYHCTNKKEKINCTQRKWIPADKLEEQFEKELMKITIMPEFRDMALEFLGTDHEKEVTERTKIHETQQQTLLDTQAQLDELTRLRIKKLIDDDDYTRERDRLKAETTKIKQLLSETEGRAEKWLELTEQTFDFATYAHARFLAGDPKTRLEIMNALGQNPTIKDEKLRIQANKWFVPIMEAYPELEEEYLRLEPNKKRSTKAQTAALTAVRTRWYAGWGSNPRP